jgi:hypothetical protein
MQGTATRRAILAYWLRADAGPESLRHIFATWPLLEGLLDFSRKWQPNLILAMGADLGMSIDGLGNSVFHVPLKRDITYDTS